MFESDVSQQERDVIFEALKQWPTPRYLEVGINFAGTFKAVMMHLHSTRSDYTMIGVDLFEDFIQHLDDPDQTHQSSPLPKERVGAVVHEGQQLRVAYHETVEAALETEIRRSRIRTSKGTFELIKGNSTNEIHRLEGKEFDVVFIDGNHTYEQTLLDFEASLQRTHPGSIILFHNAMEHEYPQDGGPWRVCQELEKDPRVASYVHTGTNQRIHGFEVK